MAKMTCSIPECSRTAKARGLCQPHYARQWRTGSPLPPAPPETPGEVWWPVPDFPDYEVSDRGRVRRVGARKGARVGRVLRPALSASGYPFVGLNRGAGGVSVTVHRLVARAFLGEPPYEGAEVRHLDNDKTNNRVGNLAWGSRQDNADDRTASGGYWWRGERHRSAILTADAVREIRRLAGKVPYRVLAKRFGVAEVTAQQAGSRRTWRHLP